MTDIIDPQSSILDSDVYATFIKQNCEQLQSLGSTYGLPYHSISCMDNDDNIGNVTNNGHAGNTAATTSVYDDFTHPPPSKNESILETCIQEAVKSTLFAHVRGLFIGSILDAVKSTLLGNSIQLQLPTDDITSQYIQDALDENKEHMEILGSPSNPKYTFSIKYRVFSALEELANTTNEDDSSGSSADEIVEEVKRSVTNGRVNKSPIIKDLYEGTKDGRYICNNNQYKIQPLYGLSYEEKNEIKDTSQNVEKELADMADEMNNDDISEPKKKKRKTKTKTAAPKKKKISAHDKFWNEMYDKLVVYIKDKGDVNVPQKYDADPQLGSWVNNQRRLLKKGNFPPDRLQKLQSIGFVSDKLEDQWNNMYDKLVAYQHEYGDTHVPKKYDADPQLGTWVNNQRARFDNLPPDRINRLNEIGFESDLLETQWNDMYNKLKTYIAEYGDANVPQNYDADPQLGTWVHTQRTQYKKMNHGHLTDERITLLNDIEFDWVWKSPGMKWVVAVLKDFHKSTSTEEEKRHCHNPYPTTTNSQPLKKVWPFVAKLRKRVRQGKKIPQWVVDELSPLGFEFDPQSYRERRKRVETKFLRDLEVNHNIKWNAWDEKIEDTDSRPDAFIVWEHEGKYYIIFKEIDEHRHDDRSIVYEQTRMTMLAILAKKLGFVGIYFVRTNTAERKEIDQVQQAGVAKLLKSIRNERQVGVHVRYVDFPFNHHHYVASVARHIDEDEDEVDLATGEEGEHHMLPLFDSVDEVFTGCEAGK